MTLLEVLNDPVQRKRAYQQGRIMAGVNEHGKQRPACAATATQYLRQAGLLTAKEGSVNTLKLVNALKKKKWRVIPHPAQVLPGDLIVTQDLNNDVNNAPDHVVFALSKCDTSTTHFYFTALDNAGVKSYKRNAGRGSRTPMQYALRQP